jgi:hypothetical protein
VANIWPNGWEAIEAVRAYRLGGNESRSAR